MASNEIHMNLFLLGHIGNGKSSTANTILGRKYFTVCEEMSDDGTSQTEAASTRIHGMTVKVVDSPGIRGPDQRDEIEQHIREGLKHCSDGFNALILVLSYGKRFTEEEEESVEILKEMLGENFIRDHCIVLFTHGENFMLNAQGSNFESWCQKQTGALRDLIDECGGRFVLFYNLTPRKREESVQRLIAMALETEKRYYSEIFEEVAKDRSEYMIRKNLPDPKIIIRQIIVYLEKMETGDALNEALRQLEIKNSNPKHEVAEDIRRGIAEVRSGEYSKALQTFKDIDKYYSGTYFSMFVESVETHCAIM